MGVTSLFGHTVGGAAGAVFRITGTLGKGVAALTLDDDYQRKRQEALNRRPRNITEGITRGAKGVGQGVYDGIAGVILKPIEGARENGFVGFFKGVGKGLVGSVARPISGVVDFASGTLDALKTYVYFNGNYVKKNFFEFVIKTLYYFFRITGNSDVKSIRPTRFISNDHIVRPYSIEDAIGYKIFKVILF